MYGEGRPPPTGVVYRARRSRETPVLLTYLLYKGSDVQVVLAWHLSVSHLAHVMWPTRYYNDTSDDDDEEDGTSFTGGQTAYHLYSF